MRNKIQKYLSGEREGFSLIELIIVIAIMAILIGVIALAVIPYINSSRESKDKQALSSVYSAVRTALADETIAKNTTLSTSYVELTATSDLGKKVNKLVDGGLAGVTNALSSEACTGAKIYIKGVTSAGNSQVYPVICFSKNGTAECVDIDGKKFVLPEGGASTPTPTPNPPQNP